MGSMTITLEDFDDDVEKELIRCSSCDTQLLVIEHSPFENGYYLYCDSCPVRMDISIYDKKFEEVESELKKKYENFYEREDCLEILLSRLEKYLKNCSCGGHYRFDSKIRCLSCGEFLGDFPDYMNVWYLEDFDDTQENRESTYIVESEWKDG